MLCADQLEMPYIEVIFAHIRCAARTCGHLGAFWEAATNSRCEACSRGGDMLSCSWCNLVYHNTEACLGGSVLHSPALDSENLSEPVRSASRQQYARLQSRGAGRRLSRHGSAPARHERVPPCRVVFWARVQRDVFWARVQRDRAACCARGAHVTRAARSCTRRQAVLGRRIAT